MAYIHGITLLIYSSQIHVAVQYLCVITPIVQIKLYKHTLYR